MSALVAEFAIIGALVLAAAVVTVREKIADRRATPETAGEAAAS